MRTTKKESLEGLQNVKSSKIVERNTFKIEYNDGTSAIRLHNTDVITFNKNGSIRLNSGGWMTSTTKERINTFSGLRVSQVNGLWYVLGATFFDGITIKNGKVMNPKKVNIAKIERDKKRIKEFVSLITEDNLPIPTGGDCWLCSLHSEDGKTFGEFRGDESDERDHLWQHIEEKYIHGSLLVNAMRAAGYNDMQIGVHYSVKMVGTFRRTLRKYLQKKLLKIAVK